MITSKDIALQSLKNALVSFNLKGYEVLESPIKDRETYILRDKNGTSLTGYWSYKELNHFIMGYGKAFKENESLRAINEELLEALKSTRSLNLSLYEQDTVGNRVYKKVELAITKATKLTPITNHSKRN